MLDTIEGVFLLPFVPVRTFTKDKNMCFVLFGQGPKSGFLQHDFIRYIIHCSAGEQHMAEQYNLILTKDFLCLL